MTIVLVDDVVVNPPLKFRIPQLSRCRKYDVEVEWDDDSRNDDEVMD